MWEAVFAEVYQAVWLLGGYICPPNPSEALLLGVLGPSWYYQAKTIPERCGCLGWVVLHHHHKHRGDVFGPSRWALQITFFCTCTHDQVEKEEKAKLEQEMDNQQWAAPTAVPDQEQAVQPSSTDVSCYGNRTLTSEPAGGLS